VHIKRAFHSSRSSFAKFLASDPIDDICKTTFQERGHELVALSKTPTQDALLKIIGEYDGLIVRSGTQVNQAVLDAGKKLQVVGRAGVGVDNVDLAAATRAGIIVMNTPGGNTTSAAELSVSLIMALARSIPAAVASLKSGKWERSKFMGAELSGKTVGVIGLGRIGQEVARFCKGLGMQVVGYDPIFSTESTLKAGITPVSLDELYSRSDIITLHVPKTKETSNLINITTLATYGRGFSIGLPESLGAVEKLEFWLVGLRAPSTLPKTIYLTSDEI
jgi:D-3-phosphoglycerate dehydrogenase